MAGVEPVSLRSRAMPRSTKKKQQKPRLPFTALVPAAQQKALELAGGDKSRVEVISPTEAIVR